MESFGPNQSAQRTWVIESRCWYGQGTGAGYGISAWLLAFCGRWMGGCARHEGRIRIGRAAESGPMRV